MKIGKILKIAVVAAGVAGALLPMGAQAHFQLIYTPTVNLQKPADIPILLLFWHPFENGHAMNMGKPEQFFVTYKSKKTELLDKLTPVTFKGAENSAAAFETKYQLKGLGDYIFALVPAPYWESTEEHFIQQITKAYVNLGETPSGWDEPIGLPTEIVPLVKPTAVVTGSTFTGRVLSDGKPVAGTGLEIEYIAAEPNLATHTPGKVTVTPPPGGTLVVHTDDNGVFTYGIPKAGFWGFAALGAGPAKEFQGKELSQDAVLWIRANDLK